MSSQLLIIDPQNDFCDPSGALSVPGGRDDMARLAAFVDREGAKLERIHVTLDSHQVVDISHPIWFRDASGAHPAPFSRITAEDLRSGRWSTTRPQDRDRTLTYLEALEANARYPHVIWPEHCLVGSPGHGIDPTLYAALQQWAKGFRLVDYHLKGMNPWTEHFSAIRAEVPDEADERTGVNRALVDSLKDAERIYVAGEASSHCVANTVRDLLTHGDPSLAGRMVILKDTMSPVPGFEGFEASFFGELERAGAEFARTS